MVGPTHSGGAEAWRGTEHAVAYDGIRMRWHAYNGIQAYGGICVITRAVIIELMPALASLECVRPHMIL